MNRDTRVKFTPCPVMPVSTTQRLLIGRTTRPMKSSLQICAVRFGLDGWFGVWCTDGQLPHPEGLGLVARSPGFTKFRASVPTTGVSGSFTTDAPPRKATAAFLMFIAAL